MNCTTCPAPQRSTQRLHQVKAPEEALQLEATGQEEKKKKKTGRPCMLLLLLPPVPARSALHPDMQVMAYQMMI